MTKTDRLANLAEQIITTVENNTKAPGMCAKRIARYREIQKEETEEPARRGVLTLKQVSCPKCDYRFTIDLTEDAKLIAEKAGLETVATELGTGFGFKVTTERIRHLAQLLTKQSGITHFGTKEADSFLRLFSGSLESRLDDTVRDFVKEKLQK